MPPRFTYSERLQNYPTSQSQALLAHLQTGSETEILARWLTHMFGGIAGVADGIDSTDGLRIRFADGDIIHLRRSGNMPELRCYTESATPEWAGAPNARALLLIEDSIIGDQ